MGRTGILVKVVTSFRSRRLAPATHPGSERIPWVGRHIHYTAALHPVLVAHRAYGENVVVEVAVVPRIGVDDAADSTMCGRNLGLDAAPGLSIPRNHDRTFDRDAQPLQLFVILPHAVIHVDQRRGDVAIGRVGVIRRELFDLQVGSPSTGGSCKEALNFEGSTNSTTRSFGVGKRTSKFSMWASSPHSFIFPRSHSALSLSYGEPT